MRGTRSARSARGARWLALGLAVALVAAACGDDDGAPAAPVDDEPETTAPDDDVADPDSPAPPDGPAPAAARGITDDAIALGVIVGDTTPLVEAGLVPDFGDFEENFDVFVGRVNDRGGVVGRELRVRTHFFMAGDTATEQMPACLGATEDDEAFAVVFTGGMEDETILCVTEQNETLALLLAGATVDSVFERSQERLFSNPMSVPRLMTNMVPLLDDAGELEGRTLGLVRADAPDSAEASATLQAALADAGYELAAEVVLPCEANACAQNDIGVEQLRAAGVDAVFTFMGPVTNPAFVATAGELGLDVQWLASDFENQVFDTTAQFMEGAKDTYAGAIGTTTAVLQDEPDAPRVECHEYFTEQTGKEYEPLSDAWRAVGNTCEIVERIVRVIESIAADGETIDQASFIERMQHEEVLNGDRRGRFAPGKFDAYDYLERHRFDADCVCWELIPGSRVHVGE